MIIMNRNPELAEHSPKTNSVLFLPFEFFDISANKGHIFGLTVGKKTKCQLAFTVLQKLISNV